MNDPTAFFDAFRAGFETDDPASTVRDGLIGKDALVPGPFGNKPMLYADYVASGRALRQIEAAILEHVLPYYANSHTEGSYCGTLMTALRRTARAEIARLCHAGPEHAVIFCGAGATAGVNRLVHLLGIREAVASGRGATILIGPYEHHSNILPWRESGAKVVEIAEAAEGGPDMSALDAALASAKGLVIGAFSAASNISGILTDVEAVTQKLKRAGALAVWDYAGGAPYLPINMTFAAEAGIDAIVLSPHKFIGGPGASGLLIMRKDAVRSSVPSSTGGGTVRFVSPSAHDYVTDIEAREEAGTPNGIGDIRAALVMIVKDVIGQSRIDDINGALAERMLSELTHMPRIKLLGNPHCTRLPIFSFVVEGGPNGLVHPQYATRLMSDLFGIQMRGGCGCAGPYSHRLLDIDATHSDRLRGQILSGNLDEKPGFIRFNLSYLSTYPDVGRIINALRALPELADKYADHYCQDAQSGNFSARVAA